ncbi:MAG: DUF3789 domain-containing protein [Oscillospiraceae bacterium]|nr:DUF3789 domain-containing protein [Oscillospiraceae bacterium]
MIGVLLGLMAGGVIGLTVGCLCAAAGQADRALERSH